MKIFPRFGGYEDEMGRRGTWLRWWELENPRDAEKGAEHLKGEEAVIANGLIRLIRAHGWFKTWCGFSSLFRGAYTLGSPYPVHKMLDMCARKLSGMRCRHKDYEPKECALPHLDHAKIIRLEDKSPALYAEPYCVLSSDQLKALIAHCDAFNLTMDIFPGKHFVGQTLGILIRRKEMKQ